MASGDVAAVVALVRAQLRPPQRHAAAVAGDAGGGCDRTQAKVKRMI